MSNIRIDITQVKALNPTISQITSQVSRSREGVSTLSYQVDSQIKARKNISGQFISITTNVKAVQKDMESIQAFVTSAMQKYEQAEKKVLKSEAKFKRQDDKKSDIVSLFFDFLLSSSQVAHILKESDIVDYFLKITKAVDKVYSKLTNPVLKLSNDLKLKFNFSDGKIWIKIDNLSIIDELGNDQYNRIRDQLVAKFGGESGTYPRRYIEALTERNGIPLYVMSGLFHGRKIAQNVSRFTNNRMGVFDDIVSLTSKTGLKKWAIPGKVLGKDLLSDITGTVTDFKFYKEKSNFAKALKGVGAAGTVLNIGSNYYEVFNDPNNADRTNAEKWRKFGVNTSVDIFAGASAVAVGGAVGSFFVPPVGTVIGAGVGMGADFLMNKDYEWLDGKSVVDVTKEKANEVVDDLAKGLDSATQKAKQWSSNVTKGFQNAFW